MYRGNKTVVSDNSNIDEKYDALNQAKISKRTRNTYRAEILTLDNDKEYINLLLKPKYRFATRTEKNVSLKQKVLTDYFKDSSKNLYVLQTNYSLQRSSNLVARMITSVPEISISLYVSTNTELHEETGKGNKQIKTSELIQLSRFDPSQRFDHHNKTQIGTLKYEYFGDKIAAGVPHFHFASKTQALMYGDTAGSDAISLDNLIRYVGALRKNSRNIELWNDDLSMPYLEILSKPNLYQTNTKIQELAYLIPPKKLVQKPFIFGVVDERADLFGLDAVLFDLILLRGLYKECQEFMKYSHQLTDFDSSLVKLMSLLSSKVISATANQEINYEIMEILETINGYNREQ